MNTASTQFVPVDEGADTLSDFFGRIKAAASGAGASWQQLSNDWAALEAQNNDIANGRWTLNNLVYQFKQLDQTAQIALVAGFAYVVASFVRKG